MDNSTQSDTLPTDRKLGIFLPYMTMALCSIIINITVFTVSYRVLKKCLHHMLVLTLCLTDGFSGMALLWFALSTSAQIQHNVGSCLFTLFLVTLGLLLSPCVVCMISIERYLVVRSLNFGIQEKLNKHRRMIVMGSVLLPFLLCLHVFGLPLNTSFKKCNPPAILGQSFATNVSIIFGIYTVVTITTVTTTIRTSSLIWKLFFKSNKITQDPGQCITACLSRSARSINTGSYCGREQRTGRLNGRDNIESPDDISVFSRKTANPEESQFRINEGHPQCFTSVGHVRNDEERQTPASVGITDVTFTLDLTDKVNEPNGTFSSCHKPLTTSTSKCSPETLCKRTEILKPGEIITLNSCITPETDCYLTGNDTSVCLKEKPMVNKLGLKIRSYDAANPDGLEIVEHITDESNRRDHLKKNDNIHPVPLSSGTTVMTNQQTVSWEIKALKMNIIVAATTFFLTLPFFITFWIEIFFISIPESFKFLMHILCLLNSLIDPFVYAYNIPEIKDAFKRLLHPRCR